MMDDDIRWRECKDECSHVYCVLIILMVLKQTFWCTI